MQQPVTHDGGTALHVIYKKVPVAEYCGIQDLANSDGVLMGGPSKRIRVLNTFADGYSLGSFKVEVLRNLAPESLPVLVV